MTWRSLAESRQPCRCSEAQPLSSWWPRTPRPRCNIGTNNWLVTQNVDVAAFTNPKAPIANFDRQFSTQSLFFRPQIWAVTSYVLTCGFFNIDIWFYMSPRYAPLYPITRRHISKGTNLFVIAEKKNPVFAMLVSLFLPKNFAKPLRLCCWRHGAWRPLLEMVWCLHRWISTLVYKSSLPTKFGKQLIDL